MIKERIHSLFKVGGARPFLLLVSSSLFNLLSGIVISHLLSRLLTPPELGDFYFLLNFITFLGIFASFGAFYSGSRLLLRAKTKLEADCYHGSGLIVLAGCAFVASIPYVGFYFFDLGLLKGDVRSIYFFAAPGLATILLYMYFETTLPATERMELLGQSRVFPKLALLLIYALIYSFSSRENISGILLLLNFSVPLLCYLILFYFLTPNFGRLKSCLRDFATENRLYGFHVYVGSIFTAGGTALLGISIAFFGADNTEVAYYAIAASLCSPLSIFPAAYVSSKFRDIAGSKTISSHYVLTVLVLTSGAALTLCSFSGYLVDLVWGKAYGDVNSFVYLLSVACVFYAIADLLGKYLSAHGYGKELRDASIVVGFVLIFSAVVLTKFFGGVGVAWARVFSGLAYLFVMAFFYKKLTVS